MVKTFIKNENVIKIFYSKKTFAFIIYYKGNTHKNIINIIHIKDYKDDVLMGRSAAYVKGVIPFLESIGLMD